jgi:hypothetical protein
MHRLFRSSGDAAAAVLDFYQLLRDFAGRSSATFWVTVQTRQLSQSRTELNEKRVINFTQ